MNSINTSAFHTEEYRIQQRLGVAEGIGEQTKGFIRPFMPEQHRAFFCSSPFMVAGVVDSHGHPWAIPFWGEHTNVDDHHYIESPSPTQLSLALSGNVGWLINDAAQLDVNTGSKIALLGLQLSTRRRNRLNGLILHNRGGVIRVQVEQSYGNCPQYIHPRDTLPRDVAPALPASSITNSNVKAQYAQSNGLTKKDALLVAQADTFYIASRHSKFTADPRHGLDVSHRGGKNGFIKVDGDTLLFPDFSGNKFFNTLGNIESDGRVGLCFVDDNNGDILLVNGKASILWSHPKLAAFTGAERFVQVVIQNVTRVFAIYPFKHPIIERSIHTEHTGAW
ncbi:pyridoxamine 5'-phosphate oxidase family protein [Alteromonas stellipolaris]|uniref:pyridoxamine 5'-phosphate oxidase family protein n=1 Tax=Alteromonas stellipolaris TaxID=233316 RepID=UPI0027360DAB|nr:pyridoxamine 5'-phosphate oxidase family protein [Alteromonas stellipolaris]MDP2596239.1 pyridoxamine 5'-phosphate oxidase family protein [Alteromonas stellipolaris]